ncbi:potassium-transporting ATPase subunit KdpC [Cohnella lupini]|uniref:Potassium-transporting ATPase KdpC subunit n=1 Tax=Cohnella lupini TaxID=1294267 RepID=A0A3D9HU56_9BACL|nr:potassium-transporting ATPase subunit KdpC [Cohnella lupini]RED52960.1 K+-transporting ATPase ATPase C chain [Cohnella lupini]
MGVLATSLRTSLLIMLVCGLLYSLTMTGIAQLIFPKQANGSLIHNADGVVIGSELIGQSFVDPAFFQGRVSSIEYKAEGSGTPNYAPSNSDMLDRVKQSIADWSANNPDVPVSELPIDLISNSGSGLDPDISPEAALAQVPRISQLTGIDQQQITALVDEHTKPRELGFLGEPTVNVLMLNIALQQLQAK